MGQRTKQMVRLPLHPPPTPPQFRWLPTADHTSMMHPKATEKRSGLDRLVHGRWPSVPWRCRLAARSSTDLQRGWAGRLRSTYLAAFKWQ